MNDPATTAPPAQDPITVDRFYERPYVIPAAGSPIVNAISVDVEDYFQVQALENHYPRSVWDHQASRVEQSTQACLDLFAEAGVRATFFTLGWVAERYPALIRSIADAGHEVASHGMAHWRADGQTRDAFRNDISRSKEILEQVSGQAVTGYRAATFSIGADNLWAFEVLAAGGYQYSSSIYPVKRDLCGMADAPRHAFLPLGQGSDFVEYPLTTVDLFGRRLPVAGGGHFRFWPYAYSRWALRRVNESERRPAMIYFHPWELDALQPRPSGVAWKSRLRHYSNLDKMVDKLRCLLSDFRFDRVDRVFHGVKAD